MTSIFNILKRSEQHIKPSDISLDQQIKTSDVSRIEDKYRKILFDQKIILDQNLNGNELELSPDQDKKIDEVCKFQLNITNFNKLKESLAEKLKLIKSKYDQTEERDLSNKKTHIEKQIDADIIQLNQTKTKLTEFINAIDDLSRIKTQLISNINRLKQTDINDKISKVKSELNESKKMIDMLNGNFISGSIFSGVEKSIKDITKPVSKDSFYTDITLDNKDIKGHLIFSGDNLFRKGSTIILEGEIISVNPSMKEYIVSYLDNNVVKTIKIKQDNLCEVSDNKSDNNQTLVK